MIVEIHIVHPRSKKHGGGFIYPTKFYISKVNIAKYPLKDVQTKSGVIPMYTIPITDLRPIETFRAVKQELVDVNPPELTIKQGSMF